MRERRFAPAPLVSKVVLQLDPPTMSDSLADAQRVQRAIRKLAGVSSVQTGLKILRGLPALPRENRFTVTATVGRRRDVAEIMEIEGEDTSGRNYMAVVDVGTSTIVAHVVDANAASLVGAQACFNSQSAYGREVMARRIMYGEKMGQDRLQERVVEDINRLISTLAAANDINTKDITAVICAGNTVMMHFLLGLPTAAIRRSPFVAADLNPPPFRAAEVGVKVNPRALLYFIPSIGSWVGGDVTAGILATGLHESEKTGVLIDIGTNGEIVVGNKDWLVACSASDGPALEGASVASGMVAEHGAIEKARVQDGTIRYKVIGGGLPRGICGSGILDAVAALLKTNVIDRAGKFVEGSHPALRFEDGQACYTLAQSEETAHKRGIVLTQDDLDNVVTAKAAIFAASKIMLDRLKLGFSDISRLFVAGGFGNYINLENAMSIGLFPPLPVSRARYVGNTSICGARMVAFSDEAYQLAGEISRKTTYCDLMGSNDYVEQFKQAMFLPHTNIELFEPRRS
ncbi:MAG: ASKHA domain-containing protein [Verrucomicrobiota bacterium]|nr:ASKHA domain-containing protein [Verrucomicrobiota bacterium]